MELSAWSVAACKVLRLWCCCMMADCCLQVLGKDPVQLLHSYVLLHASLLMLRCDVLVCSGAHSLPSASHASISCSATQAAATLATACCILVYCDAHKLFVLSM